ncbi:hypothetical protein D3C81_1719340 [compost metagenome]
MSSLITNRATGLRLIQRNCSKVRSKGSSPGMKLLPTHRLARLCNVSSPMASMATLMSRCKRELSVRKAKP